MMDEARSSSDNSIKLNTNSTTATQKARRLDAFASRLATRGTAVPVQTSDGSPTKTVLNGQQHCDIVGINCIHCSQSINSTSEARACSSCKKLVHLECDNESFIDNMGGVYVCESCRKGPLVGGDAMLPSAMDSTDDQDFSSIAKRILAQRTSSTSIDFSSLTSQSTNTLVQAQQTSIQSQFSSTPGLDEDLFGSQNLGLMSGMSSPGSASITTVSTSPGDQHDITPSDNEEYKPTNSQRVDGRSTRGGRGGAKKKPGGPGRGSTSMRTRSGGKPSIASYAYLNSAGFTMEPSEKPKRGRGGGSGKGKGGGRPRGRGRGKPGSSYNTMTYLQSSSSSLSIRREGEDRESMESFESSKQRQLEENDYIRTAIVTNANDPFMNGISLCLICGSVGKDVEGTMLTCTSCAQSYHTYCVNMHNKLNNSILKRGWRCMDCTLCEGCGSGKDESNLLLCDECDVAYHIYCLEPKLERIPLGSWRCKWCATCCRCNKQVQSGLDLQRLEGLCETCHSLRKCPKCYKLYEVGDLLIKCQHCIRWYHARCEDLTSEEAAENAAENAFRCSLCRPRLHAGYHPEDLIVDDIEYAMQFTTGRGRGRGGGPGRKMLKLGVGGFHVKIPRHRLLAMEKEEEQNKEKEEAEQNELGPNGKPRIRRPRKPRRHAIEDAYPIAIQEAFFGTQGVDGKTLLEMKEVMDEPVLGEYRRPTLSINTNKAGTILSEQSAETLRTQQEQDMLGDIFVHDLGIDMDMGMDIGEFDLSELIGEDDDDADTPIDESVNDGFSVTGSQSGMLCSPSASSAMGLGDTIGFMDGNSNQTRPHSQTNFTQGNLQDNPFLQMQQHHLQQRQQQQQARMGLGTTSIQRSNSQISDVAKEMVERVNQATERWEEDEPLGDKATKAAVLYSNISHPELKSQYPNWKDRVKHITRLWRTLDPSKRQEYVNKARENRANRQKVPRMRRTAAAVAAATTTMPAPVTKSQSVNELTTGSGIGQVPGQPGTSQVNPHMLQLQMHRQMSQPADMSVLNFEQKFKVPSVPSGSTPDTPTGNPALGQNLAVQQVQPQVQTPTMQQPQFFQQIQNPPQTPTTPGQAQIQQILQQQAQTQAQQQQQPQRPQVPQMPPGMSSANMRLPIGGPQVGGQGPIVGQPPPQFMRPPMQQHPLAHMPREVIEQYDYLWKRTEDLQKQEKAIEADLSRMRKLKKNLTAKKRALNKNTRPDPITGNECFHDLTAADSQQLAEVSTKIPERQQNMDEVRKEIRAQMEKVKEFETRYNINMGQPFQAMFQGAPGQPQQMMLNRSPTAIGTPTGQMPMSGQGQMQFMNPNLMGMSQSTPTTPAGMTLMRPSQPQTADVLSMASTPGQSGPPTAFPFPQHQQIRMQNLQTMTPTNVPNLPPGYPTPGQLTSPLLGSRMDGDQFSMHSESPTPSGGRPASSASIGYSSLDNKDFPQQRPGRGRKRKKGIEEFSEPLMRSSVLGGIPFVNLQTDFERDVFDVVDSLISKVSIMIDGPNDPNALKRLLYTHAPPDLIDGPKTKKKRPQLKKQAAPVEYNEFELLMERISHALKLCPPLPPKAFEPSNTIDKHHLQTKETTQWPDRPDKPCIIGHTLGQYKLTFMEDYYTALENFDMDEESFYPPPMGEIYRDVNLRAFLADDEDENFEEDPIWVEGDEDSKNAILDSNSSMPRSDLYGLTLGSLGDRNRIQSIVYPSVRRMPERIVPLEPHRSHFFHQPIPESEYKISLNFEYPEDSNPAEVFNKFCNLLNIDSPPDYELETPPLTPGVHESPNYHGKPLIVPKMEPAQKACRNCERAIHEAAIQESMSRLGLTPPDDKENNMVSFCTLACYYKFLVTCKIPLPVTDLEKAERHVDEATLTKLKQISVDSFAKRLNSGQIKSTLPLDTNFGSALNFASATPSPKEKITDSFMDPNFIETLRAPKERPIRVAELAEMANENKAKVLKPEFKWKGHYWTVCDLNLIMSFQRPHEEIRQKLASIQLQALDRNRVGRLEDTRICILCLETGDGAQELTGRLLNVDANEWVHVNCALWSAEVFETEAGALTNVETAMKRAKATMCRVCGRLGASLKCFKAECAGRDDGFHITCAKRTNGRFIKDKTFICGIHPEVRYEMCVEKLDALRRIYIEREENQLLAKLFNHTFPMDMMMRVGSLIFHSIGQLLPEQLKTFHNSDHIFPIGYKITRIFWSPMNIFERVRYECVIEDKNNLPEFKVVYEGKDFRDKTPSVAWNRILLAVQQSRDKAGTVLKFFPNQITGEYLFGLQETAITKMTESLPGVDQLFTYNFKHGGSPLMDVPLALNPSGCARCEPRFRTLIKHRYRPLIMPSPKKKATGQVNTDKFNPELLPREARSRNKTASANNMFGSQQNPEMLRLLKASGYGEDSLSGAFIRNDPGQLPGHIYTLYKKMQQEVQNTVYLARSNIQGLGLYAKRDIDMNSMIIEYLGEVIRSEVGEMREKRYMAQNRGVYMFRIDEEFLVDATMVGGLARYINHSCDPNCSTKILTHNDEKKIIVIANRPIKAGEELTYDYQFELEDSDSKIPCLCGAPNCNKWMN